MQKRRSVDEGYCTVVVAVNASNYLYLTLRAYQLMVAGRGKGLVHILLSVCSVYVYLFCSASLICILEHIVL
jgi:hypothetical protein